MTMKIPMPLAESLRLGRPLTIEVEASSAERLAGVTILPQRDELDWQARREGWTPSNHDRTYIVVWREYSHEHIEKGWDILRGDGMWELKQATVQGIEAVENVLESWGVRMDKLTYLWNTAIPG